MHIAFKLALMQERERLLTTDVKVNKGLNRAVGQGDQLERHKVQRKREGLLMGGR